MLPHFEGYVVLLNLIQSTHYIIIGKCSACCSYSMFISNKLLFFDNILPQSAKYLVSLYSV